MQLKGTDTERSPSTLTKTAGARLIQNIAKLYTLYSTYRIAVSVGLSLPDLLTSSTNAHTVGIWAGVANERNITTKRDISSYPARYNYKQSGIEGIRGIQSWAYGAKVSYISGTITMEPKL